MKRIFLKKISMYMKFHEGHIRRKICVKIAAVRTFKRTFITMNLDNESLFLPVLDQLCIIPEKGVLLFEFMNSINGRQNGRLADLYPHP